MKKSKAFGDVVDNHVLIMLRKLTAVPCCTLPNVLPKHDIAEIDISLTWHNHSHVSSERPNNAGETTLSKESARRLR